MLKVRDFDVFNEDNDPWGEHDFGSFEDNGKKDLLEGRQLLGKV